MGLTLPLITLLATLTLACIAYLDRRSKVSMRELNLRERIRAAAPAVKDAPATAPQGSARARSLPGSSRLAIGLERWVVQAGVDLSAREFLEFTLVFGLAGVALAALRTASPVVLLYALCPAALPFLYVAVRRRRRLATFSQQLPFVLDFLRSSLGAGLTMIRGLQMAAENSPEPIASELKLALEQVEVGANIADALESMFKRVPEESLGFLVVAVRIQVQVGSGMAEIIERVTDAIRSRQRLQKEVRTLTAQGRMSGMMVGLLPVVVLIAFTLLRPDYTWPLFHDPAGIRLLETAALLDIIAFLLIRWIIQID